MFMGEPNSGFSNSETPNISMYTNLSLFLCDLDLDSNGTINFKLQTILEEFSLRYARDGKGSESSN